MKGAKRAINRSRRCTQLGTITATLVGLLLTGPVAAIAQTTPSTPFPPSESNGAPTSDPALTPETPTDSQTPPENTSPENNSPEASSPETTSPETSPAAKPTAQKKPAKPSEKKKTPLPDQFPPNPLEITKPFDPLIPYDYGTRPLTAEERETLVKAADRLILVGAKRLQANDAIGAYEAWHQELRYRRAAAFLADEVKALGRIGDVAWTQNNNQELRYITKRLDEIRLQTEKPIAQLQADAKTPPELLNSASRMAVIEALALAYQQVRLPKIATGLYEQVLADARQTGDDLKLETTLINLGQLDLGWFAYDKAAAVYRELWQRSQARQDVINEPLYLSQLIFIHEQAKQPKPIIFYAQQAIEFYRKVNDPKPVPALIIKIADNQRKLGQLDRAEANYQLAYKVAQPQNQLADASDALKKLADMYRSNDRLSAAQRIYTFLIAIEQQAYNSYGVMDAYDQLGQLHLTQKEYPEAIAAFEQGREVARQLKIREDYFTAQIQKATEESNKSQ